MLHNSITLEDINKYEGLDKSKGEDIFNKLYNNRICVYIFNNVYQIN